jgi:hypothetical protein
MNYFNYLDLTKVEFGPSKKGWWAIPTVRQFANYKGITPREYLRNLYEKNGVEIPDEKVLESIDIDKPFVYAMANPKKKKDKEFEVANKQKNYCKYCGELIDDDSIFCKHCGKRQ